MHDKNKKSTYCEMMNQKGRSEQSERFFDIENNFSF